MSTNGSITIRKNVGEYLGVYCHNNCDIEYTGLLLYAFYNTFQKAAKLIENGDMSCLGVRISHPDGSGQPFDNPERDGTCVFYSRDRGEQKRISKNKNFEDIGHIGYDYVFLNNNWYVKRNDKVVVLLKDEIVSLNKAKLKRDSSYALGEYIWQNISSKEEYLIFSDALRDLGVEEDKIPEYACS